MAAHLRHPREGALPQAAQDGHHQPRDDAPLARRVLAALLPAARDPRHARHVPPALVAQPQQHRRDPGLLHPLPPRVAPAVLPPRRLQAVGGLLERHPRRAVARLCRAPRRPPHGPAHVPPGHRRRAAPDGQGRGRVCRRRRQGPGRAAAADARRGPARGARVRAPQDGDPGLHLWHGGGHPDSWREPGRAQVAWHPQGRGHLYRAAVRLHHDQVPPRHGCAPTISLPLAGHIAHTLSLSRIQAFPSAAAPRPARRASLRPTLQPRTSKRRASR